MALIFQAFMEKVKVQKESLIVGEMKHCKLTEGYEMKNIFNADEISPFLQFIARHKTPHERRGLVCWRVDYYFCEETVNADRQHRKSISTSNQ